MNINCRFCRLIPRFNRLLWRCSWCRVTFYADRTRHLIHRLYIVLSRFIVCTLHCPDSQSVHCTVPIFRLYIVLSRFTVCTVYSPNLPSVHCTVPIHRLYIGLSRSTVCTLYSPDSPTEHCTIPIHRLYIVQS